jgi:hypothetical protein
MLGSRGIILRMATAVLAEMWDNLQYSTRLTPPKAEDLH